MSVRRRDVWLSGLERRVRDSWAATPGTSLRVASVAYGLVHDGRDLLYEAGILQGRQAPVPILSVGGLTTGGSGKTPVSAAISEWLFEGGCRPALITGGIPDEAAVQRLLNPDILVIDDRNRRAAVNRAAESGASSIVLDSGFQHRRIRSDLQILCIDEFSASLPARRRLPAGPFRERWSALARVDAIVMVRRPPFSGSNGPVSSNSAARSGSPVVVDEVRRMAPAALVLNCLLRPTGLKPANELAETCEPGENSVAVAGVMWPEPFFDALAGLGIPMHNRLAFRDHETFATGQLETIRRASAEGVICTLKDAVKLGPLLARELPVWYLEEEPEWGEGERELRLGALRMASSGPASSRLDWQRRKST